MGPNGEQLQQQERWLARGALLAISLAFLAYCAAFVPRLTNYLALDTEFTGWAGPIGARFAAGDVPYEDFILPIPPGSFAAMAAVQQVTGETLLIQELWFAAIAHLLMGLLAYAIARPFTSKLNALLVTAATLITVVQISKEIVYDHSAQLMAWTSIAVGVRALLAAGQADPSEPAKPARQTRRPMRLWFATGLLATLTLAFKQTTAVGVTVGWIGALIYLGVVEYVSTRSVRRSARDLGLWALGAAAGLMAVWAVIASLGSSFGAYFEAVFGDAPDLKGGTTVLARHLIGYVFGSPAFSGSLALTLLLCLVAVRIARRGPPVSEEPPLTWRAAVAVTAATCLAFGVAAYVLATRDSGLWGSFIYWAHELGMVATFGLAMTCLLFAFGLRRSLPSSSLMASPEASPEVSPEATRIRLGHAFNAVFIVALAASLLHNTSIGKFRPFFDNNAIIPVAFLGLFVAFDRAGVRWLKPIAMALVFVSLFGLKFQRALRANIPAPEGTHWEGLRVPERALDVIRAAERVRELTTDSDTVLVLPEDVQLAALIGRPRPPVKGAILFVDQYPTRLVEHDRNVLRDHPPKVIVIHPSERKLWQRLFRLWQNDSGTERMMGYVLDDLIPDGYRKDLTVPTVFGRSRGHLDVWVRINEPGEPGEPGEPSADTPPHVGVAPTTSVPAPD